MKYILRCNTPMFTTGRDFHDHFSWQHVPRACKPPPPPESATLRSRCANQDSNARPCCRSTLGLNKAVVTSDKPSGMARPESARLPPAMHARLKEQVAQKGLHLPQLCACSKAAILDATYPSHCCTNCPLYNNYPLYYSMLSTLLHSYGIRA